jgi:hypothetical protein
MTRSQDPTAADAMRRRYVDMYRQHLSFLDELPDLYHEDRDDYAEHRTREEIDALLRYGHHIPVGRGWTREYVDEHFPGWTWNQLLRVLRAADVLADRPFGGVACRTEVTEMYFDSETGWLVVHEDGTMTCGLSAPGATRPAPRRPEDGPCRGRSVSDAPGDTVSNTVEDPDTPTV